MPFICSEPIYSYPGLNFSKLYQLSSDLSVHSLKDWAKSWDFAGVNGTNGRKPGYWQKEVDINKKKFPFTKHF